MITVRAIRRHLDSLRGVLTDDESAELDRLLQRHDRANALAVHAESVVRTVADTVGDSVAADATDAALIDAASKVPDPLALKLVADRVARVAEREARQLVTAKRSDLVAALNSEFTAIRRDAAKLLPVVLPLTSASDAIRAGKAAQWAKVEDLYAAHRALCREADSLRTDSLLPTIKPGHEGYGQWKHPQSTPGHLHMSDFKKFADDIRREAYVAANQAEVDQARAADREAAHVG